MLRHLARPQMFTRLQIFWLTGKKLVYFCSCRLPHIYLAPRPSLFFSPLPLPCIILNVNLKQKPGRPGNLSPSKILKTINLIMVVRYVVPVSFLIVFRSNFKFVLCTFSTGNTYICIPILAKSGSSHPRSNSRIGKSVPSAGDLENS